MEVGFLQFSPILGDRAGNIRQIDSLLQNQPLPALLVLPELANSGYNFLSHQQAFDTAEQIAHSEFIHFLSTLCAIHQIHIVSGINEKDGDDLYNSAVLLGPQGWIGTYRKLHLFNTEKDHFQPGNLGLPVFDIGICKIGIQICFDWFFPEAWRILTLKGADVICHPSNLLLSGLAQRGVPIHALINHIFTITASRTGSEGDMTFTGWSFVADPAGEIIVQASETGDDLCMIEIDMDQARDKYITARDHLLHGRRPDEYGMIISR
jgi:predicted amidohydrolase